MFLKNLILLHSSQWLLFLAVFMVRETVVVIPCRVVVRNMKVFLPHGKMSFSITLRTFRRLLSFKCQLHARCICLFVHKQHRKCQQQQQHCCFLWQEEILHNFMVPKSDSHTDLTLPFTSSIRDHLLQFSTELFTDRPKFHFSSIHVWKPIFHLWNSLQVNASEWKYLWNPGEMYTEPSLCNAPSYHYELCCK